MLIEHRINDFFKDTFAYPVHAVAEVAANEITAVFHFGVSRLREGHVELIGVPLTESIFAFSILHLLGNDCSWATGVVSESHTVLTDVGLRLISTT